MSLVGKKPGKGADVADVAELAARFEGSWAQARVITPGGTYVGTASFRRIGEGLLAYAETGTIELADGGALQATRRYVFKLQALDIACYFDETPLRLFHPLRFTADAAGVLTASADHQCGDDDYQSTYTWHSRDAFTVTHRVRGARKGYTMTTEYHRIGGVHQGQA